MTNMNKHETAWKTQEQRISKHMQHIKHINDTNTCKHNDNQTKTYNTNT